MQIDKPTVYIVHCVDTEGPLYETVQETFKRLSDEFGILLESSEENLIKLQNGAIPLDGKEKMIMKFLDPFSLNYNETWDKLDVMLNKIMNRKFREELKDSFGGNWIFNWFCIDHIGYDVNPRRKDIGYHNIYDHYREIVQKTNSSKDGIHFHFHPMPSRAYSHYSGNHYFFNSNLLFQILCRRIIDRNWFPPCYRPGFHTIRPDSHWFLEQYIPFDFSNQSQDEDTEYPLFKDGRWGDWRRATKSWVPYNPSHDDYQLPGSCRRTIIRCLNIGMRERNLTQNDVDAAFSEASEGKNVILAFADHDYRDIASDVNYFRKLVINSKRKFSSVHFKFSEAKEAVKAVKNIPYSEKFKFNVKLTENKLHIESNKNIFGPQPFFAFKTVEANYFHDNLDFQIPFKKWSYIFDVNTMPLQAIETIGIAANDSKGNVTVTNIELTKKNKISHYYH